MTIINEFGKEVFKSHIDLASILTFGLKNGVEKMENVIKNTFCKDEANKIIDCINSLK